MILLLCAVNPPHPSELPPPPASYIGMHVIVANKRVGVITHRMESGQFRVLVDAGLDFLVPQYLTLTELALTDGLIAKAHKQAAPTPAADQRAA